MGSNAQSSFRSFRGRAEPWTGMRVKVYRNINRPEFWSVLAAEGECKDLVLGYARAVSITSVTLVVRAGGHKRLRRERVRNVHAHALGQWKGCANRVPRDVEQ